MLKGSLAEYAPGDIVDTFAILTTTAHDDPRCIEPATLA